MFVEAYPELAKARNRICLGPVGPGQDGPRNLSFSRYRGVWLWRCLDRKRGGFEKSRL